MKVLFLNIDDYRRLFHLRLEALDRKQQIETKEKARKRREERVEKGFGDFRSRTSKKVGVFRNKTDYVFSLGVTEISK